MQQITINSFIEWVAHVWRPKWRHEVNRQYKVMAEQCPLVLADLARVCRANESVLDLGNPTATAALAAKRDVWLHIQEAMGLTTEQLLEIEENFDDG